MESSRKSFKAFLQALPDEALRDFYIAELDRRCTWEGLSQDLFYWMNRNPVKADWVLLNEIATRWAVGLAEKGKSGE